MLIDSVDLTNLGETPEDAFVTFEKRLRDVLLPAQEKDTNDFTDRYENYTGSYAPQRHYVSSIIAFLDERDLNIDILDIQDAPDNQFQEAFGLFSRKINSAITRFQLRKNWGQTEMVGTPVRIESSYKAEIGSCLATIRKIVEAKVEDGNKKAEIYKKIEALQLEIDTDKTTIDRLFSRWLDFTKALGDGADNIEPLVQKAERLISALSKATIRVELITYKERPKLISVEKKEEASVGIIDDEIPF